ncbi:MAG: aldolase [Chloroflexi bacterium]|jgi:fructose/tagatose bisphosphate aldolase|nr:aldolase [Chloroflexota bacterium]
MKANSVAELFTYLDGTVQVDGNEVLVVAEYALTEKIDVLAYTAVFADGLVRDTARWLIWEIAQAIGVYPASIHELYMAIGRGDVPHDFTVPAMNIRAMNYNTSRAVFRAANKLDIGAMIFEIARSEIGYTGQRPAEYTSSILAAAIKEGYRGPLYIQGDHFQISAGRYAANSEAELQAVKDIMQEAIAAGFYNIDIDTSTLVDLSFETLDEQQYTNYTLCASLTEYARELEPEGITISLGGEIGEVGHKNSTIEELHAFMQGYRKSISDGIQGISKISVQTGTSHGGVVLPDGTLAQVSVDFDTLRDLGETARKDYGLGGAVQHGASTLPQSAFGKFPEVGTVEIHLATGFQNIIFDNLPKEIVDEAYDYLRVNHANEWKPGKTDEQVLYSARKRAIGAFKQHWWDLDADKQAEIGTVLEEQFAFLFEQLNVRNTHNMAERITTRVEIHQERPRVAAVAVREEDVGDLAD